MPVCVKIRINSPPVNIVLTTLDCDDSEPDAPRALRPEEARLFGLWRDRGLKDEQFDIDQLYAFITTELQRR